MLAGISALALVRDTLDTEPNDVCELGSERVSEVELEPGDSIWR